MNFGLNYLFDVYRFSCMQLVSGIIILIHQKFNTEAVLSKHIFFAPVILFLGFLLLAKSIKNFLFQKYSSILQKEMPIEDIPKSILHCLDFEKWFRDAVYFMGGLALYTSMVQDDTIPMKEILFLIGVSTIFAFMTRIFLFLSTSDQKNQNNV